MKKLIFLLVLAILSCAGGCKSKTGGAASDELKWNEMDICALVFLGYGQNFTEFSRSENFQKLIQRFPSLKKAMQFDVETEGDELYCLIPRYADVDVQLHEYHLDIESMEELVGKELYNGGATPLLIRCNISDIHPNTQVTVTRNGESLTFSPMSNAWGREGLLFVNAEQDGGWGAEVLTNESEEGVQASKPASEYLYQGVYAEIRAKVVRGEVFLEFDRAEAAHAVGDADFTPEDHYAVMLEGGRCKSVFIGDVGQDYNPVLCCLMEDGSIEILGLYRALRQYDFGTSGRMYGHEDIVTVSNEGRHGDEGEGGGYVALVSTDAKGVKKEIGLCPWLEREWEYLVETEDGLMCYVLEFTADWKMSFKSGFSHSEALEFFVGKFWPVEEKSVDQGFNAVYNYQMKEADRSEMTGVAPNPTLRKGAFRLTASEYWSYYLEFTGINGLLLHAGEQGQTIRFERRGVVG